MKLESIIKGRPIFLENRFSINAIYYLSLAIIACLIAGCSSDADKIKKQSPKEIPSVTIEQLLEKTPQLKNPKWKSFETNIGEKIVEFQAEFTQEMSKFSQKLFKRSPLVVQFILDKNGERYRDGYCGYSLEIIDFDLVKKLNFNKQGMEITLDPVKGYPNYISKRTNTPIDISQKEEFKLSHDFVYKSLYDKYSFIETMDNEIEQQVKRMLNDKIVEIITRNDYDALKILQSIYGSSLNDFQKLVYFSQRSSLSDMAEEVDNYAIEFLATNLNTYLFQGSDMKVKEKSLSIFETLIDMGINKVTENALYGYYKTKEVKSFEARKKIIENWLKIKDGDWPQEWQEILENSINIQVPESLLPRFKNAVSKLQVIK